jgi:ADP-heptose:LPS heptosyltransferase
MCSVEMQRIVIVRALPGLGDMLCVVPAWRALRAAQPTAAITLIGLPWARAFAARFPRYIDHFLEFPGYSGIVERPSDDGCLPAFLADCHTRRFDLALQMHGSGGASNPFTGLLGARHTAGFFVPNHECPDPDRFLPFIEAESEVTRYLRLLAHLGMPSQGEEMEFPLYPADREALQAIDEARDLRPGTYACVHAGAKDEARRWPASHFSAVADALARQGLRVVLTGTPGEAALTRAVARAMRAPALNLTGRTDLGALAALVSNARLLVCNDTGVSHLAAALRVPSVVIFLASDPARWAPLDRGRHRAINGGLASGRPAGPAYVVAAAADLLRMAAPSSA